MASTSDKLYHAKMVDAVTNALETAGVTPEEIGRLRKLGGWQGHSKDADGDVQVTDLFKWQLSPTWDDGPAWPVIDKPKPIKVARHKTTAKALKDTNVETTLVLPDKHFGYYQTADGDRIPMHDETAMSLYIQIAAALQPDRIVNTGDDLDLADFSLKFARSPTMAGQMNRTLEALYEFYSQLRAAVGPDCKIDLLEGNHEARIPKLVTANAEAAFGVKRVGEDWPLLSIPYMLRFDELDIGWNPGYPAAAVWLRKDIRVIHGAKLDAAKASKDGLVLSQIQGHCFADDVELLTENGWLHHDKLTPGMKAMTLNMETGAGEMQSITEVFRYDHFDELLRLKSRDMDIAVTPGHTMLSQRYTNNQYLPLEKSTAEELSTSTARHKFPLAVFDQSEGIDLTDDQIRVIAWIVSEGNVGLYFHKGNGNHGVAVRIAQSDYDGHLEALESALDGAGVPWTKKLRYEADSTVHGTHRNFDAYRYQLLTARSSEYDWRDWVFQWIGHDKSIKSEFLNMNGHQASVFLDEYVIADGSTNADAKNSRQLASNSLNHIDSIQELAVKSGHRSSVGWKPDGVGWVTINSRGTGLADPGKWTAEPYEGFVWCVSVPNGTVVVRSNGKTMVTGNSHRFGLKSRTYTYHNGEPIQTVFVECGTGARIDGAAPSFGSGLDDSGVPVVGNQAEDWAQGCVVVEVEAGSSAAPAVEFVPFFGGRCLFRGLSLDGAAG